ncbi:uncharacterized protein H6S33_002356 [Morchella sextelata]|uniref:uncharacterized protein n=1 Tax=Morchella sextelata TaxID=1174677 RepID=UPI001D03D8F9|nr:uncharacterized protein H6S33_002356 [Morchella sextelata]KAH0608304.1 hypothetical protein H6S33_002356 [Morchella sextelata]
MDIAGLTIAVYHEVFNVCVFITQTIIDARNHEQDFGELEIKFTYHHTILQTFGKRFIQGKIIYKLEDSVVVQISQILQQLKKVVVAYQVVSEKYSESHRKSRTGSPWWKRHGGADREKLRAEATTAVLLRPGNTGGSAISSAMASKNRRGFRSRFARKRTQLEWALFDRQKLESIADEHKQWTDKLVDIMKMAFLFYLSGDVVQTDELVDSGDAQALGFSSLTSRRLLILDPSRGHQANIIDPKEIVLSRSKSTPSTTSTSISASSSQKGQARYACGTLNMQKCLVEYKQYPEFGNAKMNLDITQSRISFLSQLLGVSTDADDNRATPYAPSNLPTSLHCIGWFHEPDKSRYGLAFQIPTGYDETPMTLQSAISSLKAEARPTLGQRFDIAYTIGYALLEWHLVDWVHKGISSDNIYLLRRSSQTQWDFSLARLGGFEYARPSRDGSNEAYTTVDFNTKVYRHPARQGDPSEGFNKNHDIYSFGVLLLQIGLWSLVREWFSDVRQTPDAIRATLMKNARTRLGHYMGQKYMDAVLFCLEGASRVEGDDVKQTRLMTAFKQNVIDVLEKGRVNL